MKIVSEDGKIHKTKLVYGNNDDSVICTKIKLDFDCTNKDKFMTAQVECIINEVDIEVFADDITLLTEMESNIFDIVENIIDSEYGLIKTRDNLKRMLRMKDKRLDERKEIFNKGEEDKMERLPFINVKHYS